MGTLKEKFNALRRETNAITFNPYLFAISENELEEIDSNNNDFYIKNVIDEICRMNLPIDINDTFLNACNKIVEAITYLKLKSIFPSVSKIRESVVHSPDFEIIICENCRLYAELKVLSFNNALYNLKTVQQESLEAKVKLESSIKNGSRVAMEITEISSYKINDKTYDPYSIKQKIRTIINKINQNLKTDQISTPQTVMIIDLRFLDIPYGYAQSAVPYFIDSQQTNSLVAGILWHVAFGGVGYPIFKPIEFEGAKNYEGELNDQGILKTNTGLDALVFQIYELDFNSAKRVGFINTNCSNASRDFLNKFCDIVNDAENTNCYELYKI